MIMRWALACCVVLTLASPASAHVGQSIGFSMGGGFAHPFLGLDHVAAMVAVGLWSALAGGRRLWVWPAAFVSAMLVGGGIGHAGVLVPDVEPVIALSVVVLGLLVASGIAAPVVPGAVLIAAFATFHGHAHGAEAVDVGWTAYAAGFALATALLHVAGIVMGIGLQRVSGPMIVRALGAATAVIGVSIFMQ